MVRTDYMGRDFVGIHLLGKEYIVKYTNRRSRTCSKNKGENVNTIVQDKNNILVFTTPKTKNIYEPREKVIRYSYRIEKDGELKYQYRKQEEDYCKICFIIEDVNKKKVIVATSSKKRVEGDSLYIVLMDIY